MEGLFKLARRKHRKRTARAANTPPAEPLTLESATWYAETTYVRLIFDRAVDVSLLEPGAFRVEDPENTELAYVGASVSHPNPAWVILTVGEDGASTGSVTRLNASAANGIVAADDGGAWAGCVDLPLALP